MNEIDYEHKHGVRVVPQREINRLFKEENGRLRDGMDIACELIEKMQNGLEWWNRACYTYAGGVDDEVLEEATNFLQEWKKHDTNDQ